MRDSLGWILLVCAVAAVITAPSGKEPLKLDGIALGMTREQAERQLERLYGGDKELICGVKTRVDYGPDGRVIRVTGQELSGGLRVDHYADGLTRLGVRELKSFHFPQAYRLEEYQLSVTTVECFIDKLILERECSLSSDML